MQAFPFGNTVTSVTANTTTGQSTATPLAEGVNVVNSTSSTDSVRLPPATGSLQVIFVKATSHNFTVWPDGSDVIGGSLPSIISSDAWFFDVSAGNWTLANMFA